MIFSLFYDHQLQEINMNLKEAISLIEASGERAKKAQAEIIAKIENLQISIANLTEQLANAELTDDQAAAVQRLVDDVQALDDIVPDEPPAEG